MSHDENIFTGLMPSSNDKDLSYFLPHVLPRLMHGKLEFREAMRSVVMIDGKPEERIVTGEKVIFGIDQEPDFTMCFVGDDDKKEFLRREHLTDPGFKKSDLKRIAFVNFAKKYRKKIQLRPTHWKRVVKVEVNGQLDSSIVFVQPILQSIIKQQKYTKLHVLMPLKNMVLVWDRIDDATFNEIVFRLQALINQAPPSNRVSNYLFKYSNKGCVPIREIFTPLEPK